ncbi:hypothetical protein P4641_08225 [Halalkalibacterium halodurans]|uniref:BH2003 protein n=1 Tax=Halalkalibacterium halodurans (strain ATCC BAA-125 / DSM 18197 / FERM 7344 / JCM 9153 / C-125) TaxID=272558 RepID=Q9KBC5_HALH5|nr:hypothetical protein [Halalkalibacterium halodurans]MED4123963.1 hypothetical protein [Halalkalibacterium halodurans]BAB05722.1 BH2003 [Halalkalibacterium halodurans C-125]
MDTAESALKKTYGPNSEQVHERMSSLVHMDWFSTVGTMRNRSYTEEAVNGCLQELQVEDCKVAWITLDQLHPTLAQFALDKSSLWQRLQHIPDDLHQTAEASGRDHYLSTTIDSVASLVFHDAFAGAFKHLEDNGESIIQLAVGSAMYVATMGCLWEVIADLEGWEHNPFRALLKVYEQGHCLIGANQQSIYLI